MLDEPISKNGSNLQINLNTFFANWPQGRNFLTNFIKSREDPNEADYRLRYLAFHHPEADETDARAARDVILTLVTRLEIALQPALLVTSRPWTTP